MSDAHNIRPHVEMWQGFLRLVTYSLAGIVVILALMALFLL